MMVEGGKREGYGARLSDIYVGVKGLIGVTEMVRNQVEHALRINR